MPGIALLNCLIVAVGLVLIYKIMPETENRTLEDIELHFSDNSKRITDRKIERHNDSNEKQIISANDVSNEYIHNAHDNRGFTTRF